MIGLVYKIVCLVNSKVYIGITTRTLKKRWNSHVCASRSQDTKLYRHFRKYGIDQFTIEQIDTADTWEELKDLEQKHIEKCNSLKLGMNSTLGGEGVLGLRHSEKTRKSWSNSRKEMWKSPEYKEKISLAQRLAWKNRSLEEKQKHAERARLVGQKLGKRKRARKEKIPSWKGKGYNMKIKTHCPQGHEYSLENTQISPKGSRVCKTCKRATRNLARNRKTQTNTL